jgi:ribonucleotide reductase beta subunit family protein with ferritin-like domain
MTGQSIEPVLHNTNNKYVNLPVIYGDLKQLYFTHRDLIWFENEIDLSKDVRHWQDLGDNKQYFIKHVLAFFAASDGIIMANIFANFANEVQISEARSFYAFQNMMEDIHSNMYSKLIVTLITDPTEQANTLNAIETMPAVTKKAKWAEKWINMDASFAKRLVAFAIVEGVFFAGSFLAIYYLGEDNIMPGLCASNAFIARDEALHVKFAYTLFKHIVNKPSQEEITELITEAVVIEKEFITESLPCSLLGMNSKMMAEYIEYVAHRLMGQFGYESPYGEAKCLFPFMDKIALENQTSFFDERPTEYKKDTVSEKITALTFTDDF